MKTKNIILFALISSFFLVFLVSIWKILATLQGLDIQNFNLQIIFIFGLLISFAHLRIGNKIKIFYKSIIFSLIFVICDGYVIQKLPLWYNIGIFLVLYFFVNKLNKYSFEELKQEHSTQIIFFDFLTLFGILFFSFVILFPFYMMLITSFKTQIALLVNPLDFSINFGQDLKDLFNSYFVIFKSYKFGKYILTSTIVSVGTVIITLIFAIPAAYAIARLNFFGKTFMSTSILIIYMFPAIVLVIPLYTIFSQLGLRNSIEGLLIVYTATTLPVAIYMLQGYFKSIPKELEEAAMLDGCSRFEIFTKIILPLSLPAIAVTALFSFLAAWNEFLLALTFNTSNDMYTLPVGLASMISATGQSWGDFAAASLLVSLPVVILFILFQKFLIEGLSAGGVKG